MAYSGGLNMNIIRNMHEMIFPNIYILLNIIYYILPLTIILVLIVIAVGFKGQTNYLQKSYKVFKVPKKGVQGT